MLNWNLISQKWNQLSSQLKSQWDKITDEDLKEIDGSQEALIAKLQERYGFLRMDAEKKVAEWGDQVSGDLDKVARSSTVASVSDKAAKRRSGVGTTPPGLAKDASAEHTDEQPEPDPRMRIAREEDPEDANAKLTPPLDRRHDSRDRASQSAADNTIP